MCLNMVGPCAPTFEMTDCGDDPSPLEVFVGVWVHDQQPGLVPSFLYEGHHLCMPHALDVHAIYLRNTDTERVQTPPFYTFCTVFLACL